MRYFLVGGAVRDKLLGYPFHEKDWVVMGADDSDMLAAGFQSVGKDFPVYLHPQTKEEYALARLERKTQPGYTGFNFITNKDVTLEQDLLRRDLTINAIAEDADGRIIDPYHGRRDIEEKYLRHVSPAFSEDPVRILRVARFMARYAHLGFRIADETKILMHTMVNNGEVNHLVAERVWQEFHKALGERSPQAFIQTLQQCGALKILMPELDRLFGIPQPEKHHPEIDTGVHVLMTLEQSAKLSSLPLIRFATLMHDLGKGLTDPSMWPKHHGHETLGLPALEDLCTRLKVPTEYRELAELVMVYHTHAHRAFELKPATLLTLLKRADALRRPEKLARYLSCCKADSRGRTGYEQRNYPQANYLLTAAHIVQGITAKRFIEQGLQGKAIGEAMDKARLHALKELRSGMVARNG